MSRPGTEQTTAYQTTDPGGQEGITPLLRRAHDYMIDRLHAYLHEHGFPEIRSSHGKNVLALIGPEGTRPTELARQAGLTKQSIGEMIAYLMQHGYVETIPAPDDGRAKLVRLTARGWDAERAARTGIRVPEEELSIQMGKARFALLHALLGELVNIVDRDRPVGS